MSTYQKPKATGRVYTFQPVGWDRFYPHANMPPVGAKVRKTQPNGCPSNGTMNHCFVEDADTGQFYGLVLLNSLTAD